MSRRASSGHLVGRADELAVGKAAVQRILDGGSDRSAQVLLITGEAGIGKTRLLEELLDWARGAGAVTACGRCLEHGGEVRPLIAMAEVLAELGQVVSPVDSALRPEEPAGADPSSVETPAGAQAQLFDQVRSLLRTLSASGPVMVAIEDLHWSDRTTRGLVAELARSRGLGQVLLVGTFRSDELHRRHPLLPLLADLEHAARPERINLAPLDESGTIELADAIIDGRVGQERGRELHRRCGGNPFYAEELLAASVAGDTDADRLPAGVRHVILARTQDLEPDAVTCLQAASILAAPIDTTVLRSTTGLETERYRPAVDTLCRERFLIEEQAGFRFRHELVREVFLDELLPGERADLFARAAQALEEHQPQRLGEIARLHLSAAQLPEALRTSIQAAEAAAAIGASAEASAHYGRALDLWHRVGGAAELTGVSHTHLLRRAAEVADLARDFDLAVELARRAIDRAAEAGDRFEEGAAAFDLSGYLWNASRPGMEEAIEHALELLPRKPPTVERTRAELRSAMNRLFAGEDDEADRALEAAAAMAADLGERGLEATARSHIGYRQAKLGDDNALRSLYDGLRLARAVDDGLAATVIAVNLTDALVDLGRYQEAAEFYDEGSAVAERHGLGATSGIVFEGNVLLALEPLGRWNEAEAIMNDISRRLSPDTMHRWASAFLGWTQIQINRGNHTDVVASYRRGLEMWETGYYGGDSLPVGTGLLQLAAAGAIDPIDTDTVGAWLDDLRPGDSSLGARLVAVAAHHLIPPPNTADHAPVAEIVQSWIDRLQRTVDDHVTVPPVLEAWLDQARTEIAEATGQPDPGRWVDQVSAWDKIGCPFFAAQARHRHADALLRAGGGRSTTDRAKATRILASARRTATVLQAKPLGRDIDDLARRARLRLDDNTTRRPPTPAEPAPFGLTDRELQVLRLVNEGHSNGEIGTALFISVKTASVHVSNILRKLGTANRIEAAAIARRHQLMDR